MAYHEKGLRGAARVADALLGMAMTGAFRIRRAVWFVTRPKTFGVQAIALTPDGAVVLVRHRYVRGWHLPAGGRKRDEAVEPAILRELREEIGLHDHGAVQYLRDYEHRPSFKRDTMALLLIRDIAFTPPRTLEIAEVRTFSRDALPEALGDGSRARLNEWRHLLETDAR